MIDDRVYEELLAEALARVPIHNPEWTNSDDGDPGITLLELFAHLGEQLAHCSRTIPEARPGRWLRLLVGAVGASVVVAAAWWVLRRPRPDADDDCG